MKHRQRTHDLISVASLERWERRRDAIGWITAGFILCMFAFLCICITDEAVQTGGRITLYALLALGIWLVGFGQGRYSVK